ncbi:MAG: hypothetical protein CMD26_06685 [Flavobacteriales bacterium]|nr:hypothetical protein [Flavobacteriales bacterium]|tara:strand:- start:627 stop:2054 length:1428 start_codon:yes stop_codon:yes gene_type:complete
MKKLLLFVICSIFYCSYAQLPPNSFGADFTLTDINGEEFNLHSTLDEGKTVILDLFAVWCGPCWSFAETGVLDDLQEQYPDDVVVVAVEADNSTAASTIEGGGNSIGDWTTIIDYLLMDDASGNVANDYALAYYPTIYKICPDRMVTEVGQLSSVSAFMGEINQCSSATYSKDAKILSYDGDNVHCGGNLDNASVTIQNYSVGATLSECNILTIVDGQTVETTPWSGSLELYGTDNVNLGSISGLSDNSNISFELEYSGDEDNSNNSLSPSIAGSVSSHSYVTLEIMTDNWGEETSWELISSDDGQIASGNGYGSYESINISWPLNDGCYVFHVYDSYGDGLEASMWGDYEDGYVNLISGDGNMLFSEVQYEAQGTVAFEVNSGVNLIENSTTTINVFPNPFNSFTNLSVNSESAKEMNLEIYDNVGKVVYNQNVALTTGTNNVKIESKNLIPGLYYINVIIDGKNNIQPLTVVK